MAEKFDFKKEYKDLYHPKTTPALIDVPPIRFIMVDGKGDPNTSKDYAEALELLYGLSFSIKMSKMSDALPAGYFDYVVPPLEGLWWLGDKSFDGINITDKSRFCWTSMIRQPDFVTESVFETAKAKLAQKKPGLPLGKARLDVYHEGLSVQIMHIGPYDDEPHSIISMKNFIHAQGYTDDFSNERKHHEIYLSDPRRTPPERLKTIIRHPIAAKES